MSSTDNGSARTSASTDSERLERESTGQAPRNLVLVPAGGVGARVGAAIPKQYLDLAGRTVIERTVHAFLAQPWVHLVAVVVQSDDDWAHRLPGLSDPRVCLVREAGSTRRDTVLRGLTWLCRAGAARADDWMFVHDAARPGIDAPSLQRLLSSLEGENCGALLCVPVSDTVKRIDPVSSVPGTGLWRCGATVDRSRLWLAQTPQVFRVGMLRRALEKHETVTDEAAAIEAEGGRPRIVEGSRRNLKLTTVEDLMLLRMMMEGER